MTEVHSTLIVDYGGVHHTLARVTPQFYWKILKNDFKHFIKTCPQCQQTKHDNQKPTGLLKPLPIPNVISEDIAMNFIIGQP